MHILSGTLLQQSNSSVSLKVGTLQHMFISVLQVSDCLMHELCEQLSNLGKTRENLGKPEKTWVFVIELMTSTRLNVRVQFSVKLLQTLKSYPHVCVIEYIC